MRDAPLLAKLFGEYVNLLTMIMALCLRLNLFACLLQQVTGKDEIDELRIVGVDHLCVCTFPTIFTLVDVDDVFADTHHGVHIVGVDNRCGVKFSSDVADKGVDYERRFRVKT